MDMNSDSLEKGKKPLKEWMTLKIKPLSIILDEIENRARVIAGNYTHDGGNSGDEDDANILNNICDCLSDIDDELSATRVKMLSQLEALMEAEKAEWGIEKEKLGQSKGWKRAEQLHQNRLEVIRTFKNSLDEGENGYYCGLISDIAQNRVDQLKLGFK